MSGQWNTIYLADDKDGSKMIVITSTMFYYNGDHDGKFSYNHLEQRGQEASNFTEVGSLMDKIDELDWEDYYSVGEFVQLMLGKLELYDRDYHERVDYDGIQYGYYQLKNLCKRIVAGTEETTGVRFGASYAANSSPWYGAYWHASVTIDPVLAQAILDTYNRNNPTRRN
jgi:hypothetical protein